MKSAASETADLSARLRAAHQFLDDEPRILRDPVAPGLVPGSTEAEILGQREQLELPFVRLLRSSMVTRARIAEDALARARAEGVDQYVLLGAGYDTFAYRLPGWAEGLRVFEVDHPATLGAKRARLAERGIDPPAHVALCPADLEREPFGDALATAGFAPSEPAFFSWLGVIPYLSAPAVDATLRAVASSCTRTWIALSYVVPDELLGGLDAETVRISSAAAAARGEPWLTRFEPLEIEARLRALGYRRVEHRGPQQNRVRYFAGRADGLPVASFERVVLAS